MADTRIEKFARILVDYSTRVKAGDRVGITATTLAEPLVKVLYALILERGAFPYVLMDFPDQEEIFFAHARDEHFPVISPFQKMAFEEFDVLIKARSEANTRALSNVDPARQAHRQAGLAPLLQAQMRRGAEGSLRWMSTLFPTRAYAMEAEMGYEAYQDFFYAACHADDTAVDPVASWESVRAEQDRFIALLAGHDRVEIRSANAELKLSIQGRKFINACGSHNLPDGEIYTGPVEDSLEGWVRYSYPAVYQGRIVEGIELKFEAGKVVQASAVRNQPLLHRMLDLDPGARYVGEFAIGTNYQINRFTRNILLDEKIGGSFHMAVGAGYPETGSLNRSQIHWDMICDLGSDSEILVDGQVVYRGGRFLV
jgi:aminopeptidase